MLADATRRSRGDEPTQARDVMAFGQEIGRVLSDGRIVGRAEPFAKVFPSSRGVKRAVGLVAWGILEDIALDARLDDRGRLVADTNVRRIAGNLGLSKTTVQKHLTVLREFGFVFHEELREADSGRYEQVRYVIDQSACIERFTTTPGRHTRPAGGGGYASGRRRAMAVYQFLVRGPCPSPPDTVIWYSKQKNKKLLLNNTDNRAPARATRPRGPDSSRD